jgi:hypothetical protein
MSQQQTERKQRALLTLQIAIETSEDDCLEVLADALVGDAIDAAQNMHRVVVLNSTFSSKAMP